MVNVLNYVVEMSKNELLFSYIFSYKDKFKLIKIKQKL